MDQVREERQEEGEPEDREGRREEGEEEGRLTLLEAQVGDFVDGGAVTVHEAEELIQEQLLLRVREPTAFASGLHAAHHVLLWRSHTHTHTHDGSGTVIRWS